MSDISQTNLSEPEQLDWDTAFSSGKYLAPPPALGPDGRPIVYYGQVTEIAKANPEVDRESGKSYLSYQVDLKLVRAGTYDGIKVRTWVSTRPFQKKDGDGNLVPIKGNPNSLGKFLRAAGLTAKPQLNAEYEAAVKLVNGKAIGFTADWEAKNKDNGEVVRGYLAFPDDPERPGQKKSILKAGDIITVRDKDGAVMTTTEVKSEVLFANLRLKYFQDSNRGK